MLKANEGKRMLVLGFSGLIYSHVLTTVLAVIVCIVLVVAYLKDWIGDRKKWKGLIWSVIWVCVFTAAFWIPMVEQWLGQKYKASIPWTYVDENVIPVLNLFSDQAVGRLLLGSVVIMGCYLTTRPFSKDLKVFLWTGIGFWGITAVYPFWHLFRNVFKFLQFPYCFVDMGNGVKQKMAAFGTFIGIGDPYWICISIYAGKNTGNNGFRKYNTA